LAKYTGSKCKICRRYSLRLYLKGDKCYSDKCPLAKEKPAGKLRKQVSEYGRHLLEKQKVKFMFNITERQMRKTFKSASRKKGLKGENFLKMLMMRLDHVLYKLGFASSLMQARQIINHRFVKVNGRVCNIPSRILSVGDEISLTEKAKKLKAVQEALQHTDIRPVPDWLRRKNGEFSGEIVRELNSDDVLQLGVDSRLIVEFYSR